MYIDHHNHRVIPLQVISSPFVIQYSPRSDISVRFSLLCTPALNKPLSRTNSLGISATIAILQAKGYVWPSLKGALIEYNDADWIHDGS